MPPAAKERYRFYSVEEFLDDQFGVEQRATLATLDQRAACSHTGRRRGRRRASLHAALLFAVVATLGALAGAALLRQSPATPRGRSTRARRARARAVERDAVARQWAKRSVTRASAQALAGSSADRTPTEHARFARRRGRSRSRASASRRNVGAAVLQPVSAQQSTSETARAPAAETAAVAEQGSQEFGFER